MKKKRYQILSPDGFTIERGVNYYPSRKKMMEAFKNWKENYKKQGYYSSVNYGRIHIDDLQDYCSLKEV